MYKIICTDEKEKRLWVETSEKLSKMDIDKNDPILRYLTNLWREPGNIEVYGEGLRVTKPSRFEEKKPKWPKR